jgi:signal peptidase
MTSRAGKARAARQFVATVLGVVMLGTVAIAGVALIVVPKAAGSSPLTVLTGSMQPAFNPGDVVIVRPTDTESLKTGDVITFQAESGNPELTTHRITGFVVTSAGRQYITRGDANGVADPVPVKPEQIRGTVWYSVPYVGHAAVWASGATVRTVVDLAALALILYGGYLVAAGVLDRRRRKPEVAT